LKNVLTFWNGDGSAFQKPAKPPQGFGVRQSSGALEAPGAFESGRRLPQFKAQAQKKMFPVLARNWAIASVIEIPDLRGLARAAGNAPNLPKILKASKGSLRLPKPNKGLPPGRGAYAPTTYARCFGKKDLSSNLLASAQLTPDSQINPKANQKPTKANQKMNCPMSKTVT
jgi:hypothetical protein